MFDPTDTETHQTWRRIQELCQSTAGHRHSLMQKHHPVTNPHPHTPGTSLLHLLVSADPTSADNAITRIIHSQLQAAVISTPNYSVGSHTNHSSIGGTQMKQGEQEEVSLHQSWGSTQRVQ
jgi:hypothetical protein